MHLQKLLEENGMEGLAKAIENINKFHTENFEQMLKTIFSISYKGYLDEVAQRPSNRLRKEKLYLEEIARLKHENSELKKENKRVQRVDRKGD